ncbi:NifB/NifX family molybdenum-iron cluster-binding protein [Anaerotignum sp. MB30-C6]|uniref:NifB/NifX family molybdenum-iron cluster-binding protein n=1 Tax=Anaerotignum sp. MB30-C6 TaxID=3070814 RepID=UPI0027DBC45D|nr:NifB/NifX family molybdenum-iron cluster-binding protein [Anaerotignum sp. MB30-C6]WMI80287.1 NifB/NifX family molybdenum-iron cluster-binding protein [Anaerotignum sp. MB30-C6]
MKIAIPVNDMREEAEVCVSFGRAPYFLIYDTNSKEVVFSRNKAAEAQGGAGIKSAQAIVDEKAKVLLTVRCGQNAAEVFNAAEVKVYKTTKVTAKENIEAFEKGELALMTQFHAGFHGKA